ncbi:MAG: hypothetical protein R3B47_08880, partial [Bacteroidia bacterium]
EYVERLGARAPLLVTLWYNAYRLSLNQQDEAFYGSLKETLSLNLRKIPAIDARNFTVILNNSLLRLAPRNGRTYYLKERFNTYLMEIREGWLIADNVISYHTFNNIIQTSLALGNLEWAEQFLEEHKTYLHEEVAETIIEYNQIKILFQRKQFKACVKRCLAIPFLDANITLGIKQVQIKCLFELGEYEQMFLAFHALTMYVHRLPKKLERIKDTNLVFIKLVKNLYQMHENPGSDHHELIGQFYDYLKAMPLMPEAEWLHEHMQNFQKRKAE